MWKMVQLLLEGADDGEILFRQLKELWLALTLEELALNHAMAITP